MRKLLFLSAAILIIGGSCNNKKKAGDITIEGKDGEKVTINTNDMVEKANEMKSKTEELQKLTPLSLDELKAMLPSEIMGAKKENEEAMKMGGLANFAKAEYKINDSTDIDLSIFDCAGTMGAGYYNAMFFSRMEFEQDNETEYTKSTDFNGGKAIEKCRKDRNDCEFTYFGGERCLVAIKGNNVGIDKLKDVAKSLSLK